MHPVVAHVSWKFRGHKQKISKVSNGLACVILGRPGCSCMKVLLVDGCVATRRGVRDILKQVPWGWVVTELADGTGIMESMSRDPVQVVVMEVRFANGCGLSLLK